MRVREIMSSWAEWTEWTERTETLTNGDEMKRLAATAW